jgi:hypothetical protein
MCGFTTPAQRRLFLLLLLLLRQRCTVARLQGSHVARAACALGLPGPCPSCRADVRRIATPSAPPPRSPAATPLPPLPCVTFAAPGAGRLQQVRLLVGVSVVERAQRRRVWVLERVWQR